jgi:hypothetical protein
VWTYRSDITGFGVRGKMDLVFEVERILQTHELPEKGAASHDFAGKNSGLSPENMYCWADRV